MCDEGNGVPYNSYRAERLKKLCEQLSLDAILLITGFDSCYQLESKGLVEWLCDAAVPVATDFKAAALEEGLFVAMPTEMAWHVDMDNDDMAEDTVSALDRLLADPAAAPAGADFDMADDDSAQPAGSCPAAAPGESQQQQQQGAVHAVQPDGKLSLLLQLHPQLRRVGIARGVEVRGGVQQQVPLESIYRWPLLMALAEQLQLPMEQLFQEVVDITPRLRPLLGFVDGTHLCTTLRARRPLLTRAWLEALSVCGRRTNTPKLDLTESVVAAPVTEFVSGCGCRLKPGQYQPLALPPRVLFGARTSQPEALSSPAISLRSQAAKQSSAVLHATVEAADACSPLRVARTIFFSQGGGAADSPLQLRLQALRQQEVGRQQQQQQQQQPAGACSSPVREAGAAAAAAAAGTNATSPAGPATSGPVCRCDSGTANNNAGGCSAQQQQQQQGSLRQLSVGRAMAGGDFEVDHTDLFDLMCWYWAAVDAAWQGMEHYATQDNTTWASAQAFATQVFWSSAAAAQLVPQTSQPQPEQEAQQAQQQQPQVWPHKPHLQLQLFSWDGGPRPMPSASHLQQHNHRFKTLRATVSDIRSRSPAHPDMPLGNVLYMDTFVDVPAMGDGRPLLINVTLTHCPTYTFDFWGTEAGVNHQRVAAFRRHLQQQLQSQLQAESQAQAAVLRKSADDSTILRMQLQHGLRTSTGKGGPQRRSSLGQQQQFLLLQQLAAAGNGGGSAMTAQQQRQHLPMQLQQQQRGRGGGSAGGRAELAIGSKHALASSCCGEPGAAAPYGGDCGSSHQATKRSCCGSPQQNCSPCSSGTAAVAAAAGGWQLPVNAVEGESAAGAPTAAHVAAACPAGASGEGELVAAAVREAAASQFWLQLGRLLVPPGEMPGEVALVLTGAMKLAVMDGPLYAHSNGLVFVSRPTKVHVLLLEQVEAVWLQDFASQIPGYPDLGPCIVIKGTQPCCGLLPATHMTDNNNLAIPLRAMSKACSQHWVTVVLPAWQAAASVVKASKGATAPWPLPAMFQPFYTYWLLGPRKRYMLPQPDESIDQLVHLLDKPPRAQQHAA